MGEARRRKEAYLRQAAELLERHESQAQREAGPVKCIRCGAEKVGVIATACACGGTLLPMQPAAPPPAVDPLNIATEVYLLDALIAHMQTVVNQLAYRGKMPLAQQLTQLCGPIAAFRQQVDADTRGGILLVGPGGLPPPKVGP